MSKLLSYALTPVPYSLAIADGCLTKTDKSKAFKHVAKGVDDAVFPPANDTITIYDGNVLFYIMREVPENFKLISQKIFGLMSTHNAIFSTDSYPPDSIKAMERQRHGTSR